MRNGDSIALRFLQAVMKEKFRARVTSSEGEGGMKGGGVLGARGPRGLFGDFPAGAGVSSRSGEGGAGLGLRKDGSGGGDVMIGEGGGGGVGDGGQGGCGAGC